MHKLTKVFRLAMFSLMATQSSYADNGGGYPPNYPQGQATYSQNLYNQGSPDMNDEDAFMMQSRNRMNQMMQSNRGMISQDRNMMREGYDPNENYYGGEAGNIQRSNRSYPNQEQMMRGYQGANGQGEYSQGNNASMPQSYPLNQNYPNAPQNDNNPNRPNYSSQQRGNAPMGGSQGYNMPQKGYRPNNNTPPAGYGYQSYPYQPGQEDQYIGDRTNNMSSSRMNRGVSNTDTNASWDTTDDQTIRQSSANTIQNPQWNTRKQ